jgi:hypothetical protein
MKSTTLATIVDGVIALAIVASATILLALHDLSESTAISLIGVGVVLVGGSAKALLALKVPAPAQPVAPPAQPPVA